MRRMRTGLLFVVVLAVVAASPLLAQTAPTLSGETGLFEIRDSNSLPPGRFSFGLYYSQWDRTGGPSVTYPPGVDDPLRYGTGKLGFTLGFGLTPIWEASVSTGQRYYAAEGRAWSGVINGHDRQGRIRHNETDKIRIGTKVIMNRSVDPVVVALLGGVSIPMQSRSDKEALTTYKADWDFGISATYGVMSFQIDYLLAGSLGETFVVPNEFRAGLGFNVPLVKNLLRGIFEVNRTHYDGGTTKPDDFSDATAGVRVGLGNSGLVASGAVRVNIDRWVKYGQSPSNIGGLVQVSYMPQPPAPKTGQKVAPAPEAPAPEPAPSPAPAPVQARTPSGTSGPVAEVPPAPKPETSTTDEILFDSAKSRLTNIAKAILDGVALRLKNNLSAGCTIVAYTDPKEKGGDHMELARARAEAAKDYLVKRHGIDASRIKTEARGNAEAGGDATRNRRAVVTVAFP